MSKFILSLILTLSSELLMAQISKYERVLIPIAIAGQIPGAFGSLWESELVAQNDNEDFVLVVDDPTPCVITCSQGEAPKTTFEVPLLGESGIGAGALLWIEKPGNDNVKLNLRIQDVSRQSLTWGTEIPVIRERDAITGTAHLLNVPVDDRFRQSLRIYDMFPEEAPPAKEVLVRIFAMDSNAPIITRTIPVADRVPGPEPFLSRPLQTQILSLTDVFPELRAYDRVRIEVAPVSPGLRYWTFVGVTNNETQHVTTITPQ